MARILIVDDDEMVRSMLSQVVQQGGHEAIVAPNAVVGIGLYRKNPADIIIMDIIMPEKDGWEAIVELKEDFPAVKIIAISGGAKQGPYSYLALARRFGAQKVFPKPVRKQELLNAIDELLTE